MTGEEKREFVRYSLELLVRVRWTDPSGDEKEETATTRSISSAGALMVCPSKITTGSAVDLEIELPINIGGRVAKSCVAASGRVVRNIPLTEPVQGYGYAVTFDRCRFLRPEQAV